MSNRQTEILSFVGGLLIFSVVVGIVLVKNESIRNEIENQARGFLDVSRNILQQLQFGLTKARAITGAPKIVNKKSKLDRRPDAASSEAPTDAYDILWQTAETQREAFVKDHLSR